MDADNLIPPAVQILQRIEALQCELRALRRLLRVSRDAERAQASRSRFSSLSDRALTPSGNATVGDVPAVECTMPRNVTCVTEERLQWRPLT
jgi:hypothetical protein